MLRAFFFCDICKRNQYEDGYDAPTGRAVNHFLLILRIQI